MRRIVMLNYEVLQNGLNRLSISKVYFLEQSINFNTEA